MSSQQPRIPKKQRPAAARPAAAHPAVARPPARMPDHVPVPPAPPDLIYSRRQPPRVHQQRKAPGGDAKRKRAARKRLPRTHRTLAVLLQAVRDEQLCARRPLGCGCVRLSSYGLMRQGRPSLASA